MVGRPGRADADAQWPVTHSPPPGGLTRGTTVAKKQYVECPAAEIPAGVRFDLPRRNDGQIVLYYYGGFDAAPHDRGDPYMLREDQSVSHAHPARLTYYKLK